MIKAIFETLDYCTRIVEMKRAEALVKVRIEKPQELDDLGIPDPTVHLKERVYARQWVKQGVALYREVYQ